MPDNCKTKNSHLAQEASSYQSRYLEQDKVKTNRITELEVVLAEKGNQIDHLTSGIKARDFEYNLRTTQLEKEHADKMQDVFSHFSQVALVGKGMEDETEGGGEGGMEDERPAPSEEVAALEGSRGGLQGRASAGGEASFPGGEAGEAAEKAQDSQQEKRKEVFGLVKLQQEQLAKMDKQNSALRDTNEDLARQVMLAEHQAEQNQTTYEQKILRMSLNLEETTNLNKSLMEEVSNYKKHLRSLGSAVRISRSSLRPLSAAQVHQKQMRASQQDLRDLAAI